MSNSLIKKSLEQSLGVKSLSDLVRAKTSEEVFLAIDCSGSMGTMLRNGKRRIEGLRTVVSDIQQQRETRMIQFGGDDSVGWVTSVPEPSGSTPLAEAIEFARTAEAGRLVMISDGYPDNAQRAFDAARAFGGRIDVVFVGDPGDRGEKFLLELASLTGGTSFTGDLGAPKELASGVIGLLTGARDEDDDEEDERGPIAL